MNYKRVIRVCVLVLIGSMINFTTACSKKKDEEQKMEIKDKEIIETVVNNFMLLAKVPRPSHHEEKISNYLMKWAKEQGLNPTQDSVYNVMFEVDATKGMEDKPLGILQVHMDMVVAVADGKEFDPLNDSITVIRDDEKGTLTANGTSLGADDGAGIAIVMAVTQGKIAHGPLRIIITVDEEDGMTGTKNLDSKWLEGASYLINIDNEWAEEVLVSTASGDTVNIEKKINRNKVNGIAINVSLSNLKGGHSGVEIDKGRLNGIIGLAKFLKMLDEENINYELATFEGGTASNAIPTKASSTIVINKNDKTKIEDKLANYCSELKAKYNGIEDSITCEVKEVSELPKVISKEEKDNLIKFITEIIDGVYTMSKDMEGLVESSSNLGIVKLNDDGLTIVSLIRSSSPLKETEIVNSELELAKICGYEATSTQSSDAWPYDPNSKLLDIAKKVYKEEHNKDIRVSAVHAGLECGTFKKIKPDLDMISIGPTLSDGHTINETLDLNSIPITWRLLEGILKEYK